MEITTKIRLSLLNGLAVAPARFNEEIVKRLLNKVAEKNPDNPISYAYVIGRNWSIDQVRQEASAAKKQEKERQDKEKAEQKNIFVERCQKELAQILAKLHVGANPTRIRHLEMVRMSTVGLTDTECAQVFPESNSTLRYQWKRRGLLLVKPHASPELWHFLTRKWCWEKTK